jgi:hypothetical protein
VFPPLDGRYDLSLRDCAERRDDRRLPLAEDQRDVPSLARSQHSAAPSAGAVVREGQRQVAMQDEDCVAVLVVEAQESAVAETGRRAGVIGPGVAHELKLHLARLALDRAEDLMLRPQLASPLLLGAYRFRPPMGAPFPGALLKRLVILSPAMVEAVICSGDRRSKAAFWSGVAGASIRS